MRQLFVVNFNPVIFVYHEIIVVVFLDDFCGASRSDAVHSDQIVFNGLERSQMCFEDLSTPITESTEMN